MSLSPELFSYDFWFFAGRLVLNPKIKNHRDCSKNTLEVELTFGQKKRRRKNIFGNSPGNLLQYLLMEFEGKMTFYCLYTYLYCAKNVS